MTDLILRNAESETEGSLGMISCLVELSNLFDLLRVKACAAIMNAGALCATLLEHINRIVSLGSKEKMVRSHAWRVVAFVTNQHFRWDRTNMKLIGNSVGQEKLPADLDSSVAGLESASIPNPAAIRLRDLIKKTFIEIHGDASITTYECLKVS